MSIGELDREHVAVSEIFKSYQGEGLNAGKPAVFVRLALCNLYCSWCDTKYSWLTPDRARVLGLKEYYYSADKAGFQIYSPIELYKIVTSISGIRHLVLTGGEPLIWRYRLVEFLSRLKSDGWFIEVETNGTIPPEPIEGYIDLFNVSPKLSNSSVPYRYRIVENALRRFVELAEMGRAIFKFVVSSHSDLDEIRELIRIYRIPKNRILLMSECRDRVECLERDRYTVELSRKLGVGFTRRHHILYGYK